MPTVSIRTPLESNLPNSVQVELDIFSGRPNPFWALDNTQFSDLRERVTALVRSPCRSLTAALGYRGLVVQWVQSGQARQLRVQRGIVEVTTGSDRACFEDSQRAVERWLFATGKPSLNVDLVAQVERHWQR